MSCDLISSFMYFLTQDSSTERGDTVGAIPTIDLSKISKEDAARIMSEEHRRLGHRPPHGSLAAQARSVADKLSAGKPPVPASSYPAVVAP